MKTKTKNFDTVEFFRVVKELLAKRMEGMLLLQKKGFMLQVREGKIKLN